MASRTYLMIQATLKKNVSEAFEWRSSDLNKQQEAGFGDSACTWGTDGQQNNHGNKRVWQRVRKLETYRADNKTVEQTHFYRDYQHLESHKTNTNKQNKVHPRVLKISKATRPRPICTLLPFSLLFLRHWVSLSLFSRLIHEGKTHPHSRYRWTWLKPALNMPSSISQVSNDALIPTCSPCLSAIQNLGSIAFPWVPGNNTQFHTLNFAAKLGNVKKCKLNLLHCILHQNFAYFIF